MTLLAELLAIAHGLYFLMGAVILLGGLAIFTVEALRHLSRRHAEMARSSVSHIYVNQLHIHVTPKPASEQRSSSPVADDLALPEGQTSRKRES